MVLRLGVVGSGVGRACQPTYQALTDGVRASPVVAPDETGWRVGRDPGVVTGVQATNWRAEQAIRPAVVSRKTWGGDRTRAGADTWQALTSVLRTAVQQDRDPIELLAHLLRAPDPIVADLVIPGH